MNVQECSRCDTLVTGGAEYEATEAMLAKLYADGWRPLWMGALYPSALVKQAHASKSLRLFCHGGWACPACVEKLAPVAGVAQ